MPQAWREALWSAARQRRFKRIGSRGPKLGELDRERAERGARTGGLVGNFGKGPNILCGTPGTDSYSSIHMGRCESERFRSTALTSGLALCALLVSAHTARLSACDLCAIYRATNARGESSAGFLMTLSEQYVSYGTLQQDGQLAQPSPNRGPL